jgi:hypothetical protein
MLFTKQLIFASSLILTTKAEDLFLPRRELLAASAPACANNVLTLNKDIVKDSIGFYNLKLPYNKGSANANLITKWSQIWTPSVADCEPALCTI